MSDVVAEVAEDPAKVVGRITEFSERELEALMNGPAGSAVLDEIFRQMRDNFRPELAKGEDAVVRFVITGASGADGHTYDLTINNGACVLSKDPATAVPTGPNALSLAVDRVRFVRVISGQENAAKLFLLRKVKISGDLKLGGRIVSWFGVKTEE